MPTPTPDPTAAPEPAAYIIESIDTAFVAGRDALISVEFSVSARNVGGSDGPSLVPVLVTIDDGQPDLAHTFRGLVSGDTISFTVIRDLTRGPHSVIFEIDGVQELIDLHMRAPDLILEIEHHTIVDDGLIELPVKVTNQGDLSAGVITIVAEWVDSQEEPGEADSKQTAHITLQDSLDPEDSQVATFPIAIPTGSYAFTARAETDTFEVQQDNNSAETVIDVDYVQIEASAESVTTVGYRRDGSGIVEVALQVRNTGVRPSGLISVGLACVDDDIETCFHEHQIDSILPGTSATVTTTLTLPPGETTMSLFAGTYDDSTRWGGENAEQVTIAVQERPATRLVFKADAVVNGYWSDGTADVELTTSLLNEGYGEVGEPQPISVDCLQDGEPISDCGETGSIYLPDGFGPAEEVFMLRVPMGSTLVVKTDTEGSDDSQFSVPERILGVSRAVWDCFSDRHGFDSREGCGGWYNERIYKWDQADPVKVWATGHEDYVDIFLKVLEDIFPLLNLQFQVVNSKATSHVEAYMGVPSSTALELGWPECEHTGGCATRQVTNSGRVVSGVLAVWYRGEVSNIHDEQSIRGTITHEALHALVPIAHRHTLDALMGRYGRLSAFDEDLIRLNSHPLIKPNMPMSEVRELIVLDDELLDLQPPSPQEEVWSIVTNAGKKLQEAGSVRFSISGKWTGSCGGTGFGPATYEVGGFAGARTELVRYEDLANHFLIVGLSDTWREVDGIWHRSSRQEARNATTWYHQYASPMYTIINLLTPTKSDKIRIIARTGGQIVVEAIVNRTTSLRRVSLEIDEETHQISSYSITRVLLPGTCTYQVEGRNGEYGIPIAIPEEVRNA